ncbi:MAG: phosphoesterase, PA-phosphatase related [uncultured Paraburkholderia sp.]|nr:MAG: phosphoesterase, PA-phosphatase related [uncultured Paraburkholderia sp.]CAH2914982.1 MAG: phosphoesterase, PA-phosphatase related [uncultured Paraburkholderia sp.]
MNNIDSSIETYLSNIHFSHFATQSIEAIADLYTFKGLVLIPVLWWMWFLDLPLYFRTPPHT